MTGSTAAPTGRDDDRTEQQPGRHQGEGGAPTRGRHGAGRNLYWLLPTLAFLAGLLLGGGVIAAADLGSRDEPPAAAQDRDDASSASDGDRTITVPGSCVDGLDRAEAAVQAAREGADAVGRIDTAALQRALDRLQALQPQITDLANRCRVAATDGD